MHFFFPTAFALLDKDDKKEVEGVLAGFNDLMKKRSELRKYEMNAPNLITAITYLREAGYILRNVLAVKKFFEKPEYLHEFVGNYGNENKYEIEQIKILNSLTEEDLNCSSSYLQRLEYENCLIRLYNVKVSVMKFAENNYEWYTEKKHIKIVEKKYKDRIICQFFNTLYKMNEWKKGMKYRNALVHEIRPQCIEIDVERLKRREEDSAMHLADLEDITIKAFRAILEQMTLIVNKFLDGSLLAKDQLEEIERPRRFCFLCWVGSCWKRLFSKK